MMGRRWQNFFASKLIILMSVYLLTTLLLYWIVGDDWERTAVVTEPVSMSQLLPERVDIQQDFTSAMDNIEQIVLVPHLSVTDETKTITLSIFDQDALLLAQNVDAETLVSDKENKIKLDPMITNVKDHVLTLRITQPEETGISFWAGNTVNAGKFDVAVQTSGLQVDGEACEGKLVLSVVGHDLMQAKRWFWPVAMAVLIVAVIIICMAHFQQLRGRKTRLTMIAAVFQRYRYLLKQLVVRDFRVKYKSTSLGMVWSLLNPLLTMLVYLFVFSTLFRSDIDNFPVYLISGIVIYSYFSEATNLGMASIVGNSALITKVYMPKMIYPLSKVLSSAINFCLSMIPLGIVMMLTGVTIHRSILLLPLVVVFLIVFSFGVSLILATLNVFFRDTQFLWSVLLMMLNFLTPVFYPESIIPHQFLTVYHMNPLYQIIYFMRTIIIHGVSPTPATYLYCILSCGVTLLIGIWIFRKQQDRFIFYL